MGYRGNLAIWKPWPVEFHDDVPSKLWKITRGYGTGNIYIYMISVGNHSKIQRNYRFTSHYTISIFPEIMHIIPVNLAVAFINIQLGMMYELWSWNIIKWGNFKNATFTCDYLRVCKNGKQFCTSFVVSIYTTWDVFKAIL